LQFYPPSIPQKYLPPPHSHIFRIHSLFEWTNLFFKYKGDLTHTGCMQMTRWSWFLFVRREQTRPLWCEQTRKCCAHGVLPHGFGLSAARLPPWWSSFRSQRDWAKVVPITCWVP
jgi:hypothetical protein